MTTEQTEREDVPAFALSAEKTTDGFLRDLTELCRYYHLGITGGTVFCMESGTDSDFERTFSLDEESKLEFR